MIDGSEIVDLAVADFGRSATLIAADGHAVDVVGIYELGGISDQQGMTTVTDTAPHFTLAAASAGAFAEGDSIMIDGVRRTIIERITDGSVVTFLLDKTPTQP